jgi:hypothetical protein
MRVYHAMMVSILCFLFVLGIAGAYSAFVSDRDPEVKDIYATEQKPVFELQERIEEVCRDRLVCTNKTIASTKDDYCDFVYGCEDEVSYEQVLIEYEEVILWDKRIGVEYKDRVYLGVINIHEGVKAEWSVPIGDRNFKEYPLCRAYEKRKGVCNEIKI